jgi:hypothetical protein
VYQQPKQLPLSLALPVSLLLAPQVLYQLLQVQQLPSHLVDVAVKHLFPSPLLPQALSLLCVFPFCIEEESLQLVVLAAHEGTPSF